MATHTTLTSLFSDIANAIRQKTGDAGKIVADNFPTEIKSIRTQIGSFTSNNAVVSDTGSLSTVSQGLTIKGMCYGGGYWVAIANNSGKQVYAIYATSLTGPWTAKMIASKQIVVNGIAYAGGYFFCGADDAQSQESINGVRFSPSNMTSGTSSAFTHAGYRYLDVVSNGTNSVGVGYSSSHACCAWFYTNGSARNEYYGSGITKELKRVCIYQSKPVCITGDGYYASFTSMTPTGIRAAKQIASGLTTYCIADLGGYLTVAGTKSDGTYLYYSNGTAGSLTWSSKKLLPKSVTPMDLAYVSGQCVLLYKDGSNLCIASAKTANGDWLIPDTAANGLSGYTNGTLDAGNNQIGVAASGSSNCKVGNIQAMHGLIVA